VSQIRVLSAGEDLLQCVLEKLPTDPAELPRTLCVFSGKRPAFFLRKALAERLGRSFLPPGFMTMESLVDTMFRDELGRRDVEVGELDALALLFTMHRTAQRRFGAGQLDALETFLPLGRRLFAALEELHVGEIAVSRLREISGGVQFDGGAMLAGFYEEFYARLHAEGACTSAMKLSMCAARAEELRIPSASRVILAGLYAFSAAGRVIVRRLLRLDKTHFVIHDGPGVGERLRAIGVEYAPSPPVSRSRAIHLYRAADTHGEVLGIARVIDTLRREGVALDERTVLVLPSADALFPVVQWILPRIPRHNISLGYPAKRTPVFGFLTGVFQAMRSMADGKVYAPDYLRCVLHPYVKNIRWGTGEGATRILFHTIEEFLAEEGAWTFFGLDELESFPDLLERCAGAVHAAGLDVSPADVRLHLVGIHDATLRRFAGAENLGDAARRTIDMLMFIADTSPAHHHGLFRQFVVEIMDGLDRIATSRLADVRAAGAAGYALLLRTLMEETVVPFSGTPLSGIQILGPLETRNLRFDRLCMLDVNEDLLPGGGDVDPLLPPQVRALLGMPGRREREEEAAYQFFTLLDGAREAHLFYREGGTKEKSRFIEQLLWERQRSRGSVDDQQDVSIVELAVDLAPGIPGTIAKTPELQSVLEGMTFSATSLDTYLRCPLRFYYGHVLGLAEREEAEGEIDRASIGIFVHHVLAEFFRGTEGTPLTASSLDAGRLDRLILTHFERSFGRDQKGPRLLTRLQIQAHLREFLTAYRLPLVQAVPVVVLAVEKSMHVEIGGFRFRGKADHIERRGERTFILDYKTGSKPERYAIRFDALDLSNRTTWSDAIGSLQLPLYALLYSGTTGEPVEQIRPAYVMLGAGALSPDIEHPLFGDSDDPVGCLTVMTSVVLALAREIGDASLDFVPAPDLRKECPGCQFQGLCGTMWTGGREGMGGE
jgi:CRISPR/Cas system-associated exonuclease Cas4 (RecB family)